MSAQTLQEASALMAATAQTLTQLQGKPVDAASAAQILLNTAVAAGSTINPSVSLALSLGASALSMIHVATSAGTGLTTDQLKSLFAADDAAKAADLAAQKALSN